MTGLHEIYYTHDGEQITVRMAEADDAANLLSLKKSYIANTRTIPLFEDEYKNDAIQEKDLIMRYHNEANSLLLVAEYNGGLIGNIDLTGSQRRKLFHTAMVGMGIRAEWQNKKIGSFLMESAIAWANNKSSLSILWLDVYSTNFPGIRLYGKFGFKQCGIMKNFIKENVPVDKITMIKYLDK